jgi:hypothetical protein
MNELKGCDIEDINTLKGRFAGSSAWRKYAFSPGLRASLYEWAIQEGITPITIRKSQRPFLLVKNSC